MFALEEPSFDLVSYLNDSPFFKAFKLKVFS